MYILSIESSRYMGGIALLENDRVIDSYIFNVKATYSEKLLYNIDFLLKNSKIKSIKNIDLVAISEGPGSFTGLRIGFSVAKTISYVKNIPIIGVNSLKAMTYPYLFDNNLIVPLIDARRNEIFASAYIKEKGKIREIVKTGAYKLENFLRILKEQEYGKIFIGEAASDCFKSKILEYSKNYQIIDFNTYIYTPSVIGKLAFKRYKKNNFENLIEFEPAYYRKSDAEINYENKKS